MVRKTIRFSGGDRHVSLCLSAKFAVILAWGVIEVKFLALHLFLGRQCSSQTAYNSILSQLKKRLAKLSFELSPVCDKRINCKCSINQCSGIDIIPKRQFNKRFQVVRNSARISRQNRAQYFTMWPFKMPASVQAHKRTSAQAHKRTSARK